MGNSTFKAETTSKTETTSNPEDTFKTETTLKPETNFKDEVHFKPEVEQMSCPAIEEISNQTCSTNVNPTAISLMLQKTYGSDLVYAILAKQLAVCLSRKIFLEYIEGTNGCSIEHIETRKQSDACSQSDWELNVLLTDIIEGNEVVKHGSILIINHAQRFIEYFEPNGAVSWTEPCGAILVAWAQKQYPGYVFIMPEDFCPIGPQSVTGQDTCWLWSLLYFYLRIKCPSASPRILIDKLLSRGPLELSNLLIRFGCYIKGFAGDHKLGTAYAFYKEAKTKVVQLLETAAYKEDAPIIYAFSDKIDSSYLSGDVKDMISTVFSNKKLVSRMDKAMVEKVRNMIFLD